MDHVCVIKTEDYMTAKEQNELIIKKLNKINYTFQNLTVVFAVNGIVLLIAFFR